MRLIGYDCASELFNDKVLDGYDPRYLAENIRLVAPEPEKPRRDQFRRHPPAADRLSFLAERKSKFLRLSLGARVRPKHRLSQECACAIEQSYAELGRDSHRDNVGSPATHGSHGRQNVLPQRFAVEFHRARKRRFGRCWA